MPKPANIARITMGKGYAPPSDILERIDLKLEECARRLNYEFEMPAVKYDLKGKTAGLAYYYENRIELNAELLRKETEEMIEETLPHEFAHIAAYKLYGKSGVGHGHYWKLTMIRLGLEPKRCHNMEVTPAKKHQKFNYVCGCEGKVFKLGKNLHGKIQGGQRRWCRDCKVDLTERLA